MATLIICDRCAGSGLVDRPAAEVGAREVWVRPLFAKECCDKCVGSGKMPLDNATVKET